MKQKTLRKKIIAGLAALAVLGTIAEFPVMEQSVYASAPELPAETNTSFAKARELEFGASMAGTLSVSDSSRYYKFSLNEASRLNLGMERSTFRDMNILFYDASQTEIYHAVRYDSTFSLEPIYLTGGDYYMVINHAYNQSFSFVVNMDSVGESFKETQDANNDMPSDASVIGFKKKYKGVLAQNEDIDYYTFQVPAAGEIKFNMTNSAANTVKYIFYNHSLNPAYTSTVRNGQKTSQPVSMKKGVYYLAIAKEDVNWGTGSYTFSIDFIAKGSSVSNPNRVTVKQAKLKSVQNSARKRMTVKWGKVSGASGYVLWYSTSPNFKKGVVKKRLGSSVTSKTYSGLKKKKTYYVKIRAYKNVNGAKKYGKWSNKKSVKIRK